MEQEHDARTLDPVREPARWERLVSVIVTSASPELGRRRRSASLPDLVLQWARPALATAATVALLISAAAVLRPGGMQAGATTRASVAGSVMPEQYAAWLVAGYEPTVTELVVALEGVP
jgi:hypothetical protein